MVVDFGGTLALANQRARTLFSIAPTDLGRPVQDLQISYRPADLRSGIDRAYTERREIVLKEVEWSFGIGDVRVLRGPHRPARRLRRIAAGRRHHVPRRHRRQADRRRAPAIHRELESAYEELQLTNEELETTNEELQSTVEELETTGEELQLTNEELETMNEELQSTNEELETLNEELRRRSDELNRVNTFLEAILGGLRGGVVVLDRDFVILIWSPQGGGPLGPARRRGPGPEPAEPRFRAAGGAAQAGDAELPLRRGDVPGHHDGGDQSPGKDDPLPHHLHADDRRRWRQRGHPDHGRAEPAPSGAGPSAGDGESRREPHAPSPASPAPDGHGSGDQVSPGQRP